jgi:cofilin
MAEESNHLKTAGETLEFQKIDISSSMSEAGFNTFQELKVRRKHRFIVFKMGPTEVEVETVGTRKSGFDELKAALPFTECRFCIFDQDYTTLDGRPASKLWFVSWFPQNATTHHKMAYTSLKGKLCESLPGVFDTQVGHGLC